MNFLDHNDDRFARTRKVLDARMKSLVAQGIEQLRDRLTPYCQNKRTYCVKMKYWAAVPLSPYKTLCFSTHVKCSVFVDVMNTVNLCVNSLFSTPTTRENSFSSWADEAKPTKEDYDRSS